MMLLLTTDRWCHGAVTSYSDQNIPETLYLPAYTISPEEIFQGKILLFNVNFFEKGKEPIAKYEDKKDKDGNVVTDTEGNPIQELKYYYYLDENGKEVKTSKQNMATELRGVVSKWYVTLRNIALVMMMIILIYIGIRMLLSTIASDKAKYKQMLQDWIMALLLLFLMHYIMAFSVKLVEKLTDIVSSSIDNKQYYSLIPFSSDNNKAKKFKEFVKEAGLEECYVTESGEKTDDESKAKGILYPTNLMGYIRIDAQLTNFGTTFIGKSLCFMILVLMTLYFVFTYLKRVLYMAFLTIIAPLVAVTYPIDKIKDGSAQGFDKWFKEYIFNLLIQPLHLLLYYILITSAWNLSASNILYSLVALGFLIPAEKLLRSFFGFEKAHTPGMLAGPAGAALTMGAMKNLSNKGKKALNTGNKGENSNQKGIENSSNSIRQPKLNGGVNEASVYGEDTNNIDKEQLDNTSDNKNIRQNELLDAYDDNYNTDEWNAQERDAMAKELNSGEGMKYSNDENENILRESGYSEDEIKEMMGESSKPENKEDKSDNIKMAQNNLTPYQKPKRNLGARARRRARAGGKKLAIKGLNMAKNLPSNSIRFVGNVTGAVLGGSIGLAAGIVSGDPNKAFQYTTAGAMAGKGIVGNNITGNIADKVPSIRKLDNPDAKYQEVMNNKRYDELERNAYIKGKRDEMEKALKKNFDKKEVKNMMDNGTADKYIENEISADDMVAGERMRREDPTLGIDKTILTIKNANAMGSEYKGLKAKEWEANLAENIQNKSGRNANFAKKEAKTTMERIARFNKIKKSNYK